MSAYLPLAIEQSNTQARRVLAKAPSESVGNGATGGVGQFWKPPVLTPDQWSAFGKPVAPSSGWLGKVVGGAVGQITPPASTTNVNTTGTIPMAPFNAPSVDSLTTPVFSGSAEDQLLQLSDANSKEYDAIYRPNNRAIIASIGSTPNLNAARAAYAPDMQKRMLSRANDMTERNAGRYGIAYDHAAQKDAAGITNFERGKARTLATSGARVADFTRDQAISDAMINTGKGIGTVGTQQLTSAADAANQVRMTNNNIAAQNQAAQAQMAGTTASMALMYLMLA